MKNYQIKILFLFLLLTASMPLFAQAAGGDLASQLGGLNNVAEQVLGIFTGKIVQIILVCCFIGCCVAFAFNKDNDKMKKSIISIGVAIILLGGASAIVGAIWGAGGGTGWDVRKN